VASRSDGIEKRERLLQAALAVFANKGFRAATLADICELAEANGAAVNYHFGGKEQLYEAVWTRAWMEADHMLPVDGGLSADAPAEMRLRALIAAVLSRILRHGSQSQAGRLLLLEMADPVPALREVRRAATQPIRERIRGIVAEMLDVDATTTDVNHCAMSVMHQMLAIGFRGGCKSPLLGEGPFTDTEVDALIEHVYYFSLGGIEAIGQVIASRNVNAHVSTSIKSHTAGSQR